MQYIERYWRQWRPEELRNIAIGIGVGAAAFALFLLTVYGPRSLPLGHLAVANGGNAYTAVPDLPNTGAPLATSSARALEEPMVTFNIDGGFESGYLKALPVFDAAGYKTLYSFPSGYLGYSGYVNEAQLAAVRKRGHEIAPDRLPEAGALVITSDSTFEDIKARIDRAVKNDEWLTIVFHRIDEDRTHDGKNVSLALVKKVIQYVREESVRVVTSEEGSRIARSSVATR